MSISPAFAGLIGTGISSALNFASQARMNAQNKQMAEDAFRKEQEAIKRQNEYNSPSMQVARLKAAGLSPNLAYGANGELVGQQSDIPSFSPIAAESPKVSDFGESFVRSAQLGLNAREQLNRNKLAEAEIAVKDAQSYLYVMTGNKDAALAERTVSLLGYDIAQAELNLDLSEGNIRKIGKEIEEIEQNIAESASRIGLNEVQVKELAARTGLEEAEAIRLYTLLPYEVQKMDAEATLAWASSLQAQESVRYMAAQTYDMAFHRDLSNRKFDFEKGAWKNEQDKWIAEFKQDRANRFADAVTRILTFSIGANALKHGQSLPPQRQPSPLYTPSGTKEFGESWVR